MIILPRHFAPLFPPGIYTFRSFLKRVSTRRFGIFQVGPSNVRKMPGCLAVRRIDEPRIRLNVWRENPRLISTRQKIWQWRNLPSPTEFHDSFSSLNPPANRNVACRPLSAHRNPCALFPSIRWTRSIIILIIKLLHQSRWKLNLFLYINFLFWDFISYSWRKFLEQ